LPLSPLLGINENCACPELKTRIFVPTPSRFRYISQSGYLVFAQRQGTPLSAGAFLKHDYELVNAVARRSPIYLAGRYIGMLQQRDVTSRLSSKNGYRAIGSHVLLGNICL